MNAQEMFEKLGYKLVEKDDYITVYGCGSDFIKFLKGYDGYELFHEMFDKKRIPMCVGGEEHLAIHQQMIELGWIEK